MNTEKAQTLVNFISFSNFIKGCIMSQDDQLFRIEVRLQKNARNFYIITWNLMQREWSYSGEFIKKARN